MKLFTIGFTGKDARKFFGLLKDAGVKTLLDIRLNNRSQLAAFTKAGDLEYCLRELCGIGYHHSLELAPNQDLLDAIRKKAIDWEGYVTRFEALMMERGADKLLRRLLKELPGPLCLLCSEPRAADCHRSLVAARILKLRPRTEVIHL